MEKVFKYLLFSKNVLYGQLGPWCHPAAAFWREFNAQFFKKEIFNSWAALNFFEFQDSIFNMIYSRAAFNKTQKSNSQAAQNWSKSVPMVILWPAFLSHHSQASFVFSIHQQLLIK
jgi:hypothetical protein